MPKLSTVLRLSLFIWPVILATASAQEPCTSADDQCACDLLREFCPKVEFKDDGSGTRSTRREYPVLFVGEDDDDVENNYESTSLDYKSPPWWIYANAVRMNDGSMYGDTDYWLLEYHFYYPRNWADWAGCNSHEHDWEWVYVFAGWSETEQRYMGYAAVLSAHSDHNLDAMVNRRTYLFPDVWQRKLTDYVDPDQRLKRWTENEDDLLTKALVKVTASGNAFDQDASAPQASDDFMFTGFQDYFPWQIPEEWYLDNCLGDPMATTENLNCYGNPGVCPFHPDGECEDCESNRWVPWARVSMWDHEFVVPDTFDFPDNLIRIYDPEAELWVEVEVEPTNEGLEVCWEWANESLPVGFDLVEIDETGASVCLIGAVPANGIGVYEVRVVECQEEVGGYKEGSTWVLCWCCQSSLESFGGELELWAEWQSGEKHRVGAWQPLDHVGDMKEIKLRVVPNPIREEAQIHYLIPKKTGVKLEIVDILGRRVRMIDRRTSRPGWHRAEWDGMNECGRRATPGIYWVRLCISGEQVAERIILLH